MNVCCTLPRIVFCPGNRLSPPGSDGETMTEGKLSHFSKCQHQEVKKNKSDIFMLSGTIFPVKESQEWFSDCQSWTSTLKVPAQNCCPQFYR